MQPGATEQGTLLLAGVRGTLTCRRMEKSWARRTSASYTAVSPCGWNLPNTSPTTRAHFLQGHIVLGKMHCWLAAAADGAGRGAGGVPAAVPPDELPARRCSVHTGAHRLRQQTSSGAGCSVEAQAGSSFETQRQCSWHALRCACTGCAVHMTRWADSDVQTPPVLCEPGPGPPEGLVVLQAQLVHGVQDAAVHRFEAVPHIRQRPAHDDRHGVLRRSGRAGSSRVARRARPARLRAGRARGQQRACCAGAHAMVPLLSGAAAPCSPTSRSAPLPAAARSQ